MLVIFGLKVKDPLISNLEEREKAQYDEEENEKEEEGMSSTHLN